MYADGSAGKLAPRRSRRVQHVPATYDFLLVIHSNNGHIS